MPPDVGPAPAAETERVPEEDASVITQDPDPTKGSVKADFFAGGRILLWSGTKRRYQHMVWAYVLASRTKGLL